MAEFWDPFEICKQNLFCRKLVERMLKVACFNQQPKSQDGTWMALNSNSRRNIFIFEVGRTQLPEMCIRIMSKKKKVFLHEYWL